MGKITVIGIGPGNENDMTFAAKKAIAESNVIISYKYYLAFVEPHMSEGARVVPGFMKQERQRAEEAFVEAEAGNNVAVVSSGDAGIYGMAPLLYEMKEHRGSDITIEVIPGISAFQKAGSILGAPMGHDFCVISLSDLMTPWALIEKRIKAAAMADFITAVYNPKSGDRYWQLYRLKELFLQFRDPSVPVGIVHQAGRQDESVKLVSLGEFNPEDADMFTVVILGNSMTRITPDGKMVTPRGYYRETDNPDAGAGQKIMIKSFRTIMGELRDRNVPLEKLWPLLHAIHTTADFEMEKRVKVDEGAVEKIYEALSTGKVKTIVTDVTMAASGIRKAALERFGVEAVCYLNRPGVAETAASAGITRTQAAIREAVKDHPDALYVFGNAPTALMELCHQILWGKAKPCGIIAAPVGFVHVEESKHMVKPFTSIPKIIVEGRKGGSNLAATLVNSILSWPDAQELRPGRDV